MSITELIDTPANDIPLPFFTYRSVPDPVGNDQQHNVWRASASYVSGAHSMKLGYQAAYQVQKQFNTGNPNQVSYTFWNAKTEDRTAGRVLFLRPALRRRVHKQDPACDYGPTVFV